MKSITLTEFKYKIASVRRAIVERVERFLLTFQGEPFARLGPVEVEGERTVILSDGG